MNDPFQKDNYLRQLLAEVDEAAGQISVARGILEMRRNENMRFAGQPGAPIYSETEQQRWLAWHKLHEAITNLSNVADGIKP